jgi:hypothetical protein
VVMEREFLELMPDTITIVRWVSQNFYGGPSYDDAHPRTYRCRIVGKGLSLRTHLAEDETVVYDVYVDAKDDIIQIKDKIILPPDPAWQDQTPVIFSVGRYPDEHGQHHTKIQCGWQYHRQGQ